MLVDEFYESAAWKTTNLRATNDTGSMLDLTSMLDYLPDVDGFLIPDVYTLTASGSSGSGATRQATITVTTASKNNPNNGHSQLVIVGNSYDDTWYDLFGKLGLSFNPILFSGTVNDGDISTIAIGQFLGTHEAGGVTAGSPGTGIRHRVTNNGAAAVTQCKARVLPKIGIGRDTGHVFYSVKIFAEGATAKYDPLTGQLKPYVLSISGVSGSGAGQTCNLSIDGVVFGASSIRDLTTNGLVSGTGLKADNTAPTYPYRIETGPLIGMEFILSELVENTKNCNVLVFDGQNVQIAPDATGTEGDYGTTDVDLTESGQTTGTITPSGVAYYWSRISVNEGANGEANPYFTSICLEGNESEAGSADWSS